MTLNFPTLDYFQSEETGNVQPFQTVLSASEDRKKSDLAWHLEALKASHRKQLENLELQHHGSLDNRLQQNYLLCMSTEWIFKTSTLQENISDGQICNNRRHCRVIGQNVTLNGIKASNTVTNCERLVRESPRKPLSKDTQKAKEEADLAECQNQFRVAPVPEHISKCLYDDLIHEQERLRNEGHDKRKDFLLSMQKPFRFHKWEEKKREREKEKMTAANKSEKTKPVCARKPIPKAISDSTFSQQLKEQEQQRKICIYLRAQETLKASSAPIQMQEASDKRQVRSAQKTKNKMLGYLDQRPSFRPNTNDAVPDFHKLYQAFQQKTMETPERRDVTHCKPFQLRTSVLQPRIRNPENPLNSTNKNLRRSCSFGDLTSLSMDTLPTYITDAARKRCMAIRRSLELKEHNRKENAEWMRQHMINSQAMTKVVAMRAKAMDPHKSLKEVYQEKLRQHRQADLERLKDYQRELKEIRARVTARPYLFEQVSQNTAKKNVERRYRNTLKQAGLNENFVRSKGENDKTINGLNSVDDDSEDKDRYSIRNKTHQRK